MVRMFIMPLLDGSPHLIALFRRKEGQNLRFHRNLDPCRTHMEQIQLFWICFTAHFTSGYPDAHAQKAGTATLYSRASEGIGRAAILQDRKSVVSGQSVSVRVDLGGRH